MTHACFVTGTDTEIGKTLVTTALLHACRRHGLSALGMKPVAAGTRSVDGQLINDDVEAIVAASSVSASRALINPYVFDPPIAPHIAAAEAGTAINADHVAACYRQLAAKADIVIVEGVGGFLVPLAEGFNAADLARKLDLPIVLVVGLRLGCINHALLSAEAIRARGLSCLGWVANRIDPDMARAEDNIATLQHLLDPPCLGTIEHLSPADPAVAAARLQLPAQWLGS